MMRTFPVIFVAHGAPLLAVDAAKGAPLRQWGKRLGRPDCVVAISAHWARSPVTLGHLQTVPLIYDFAGFPRELYELEYGAPGGAPWAEAVSSKLGQFGDVVLSPERGLDHGVWVPLFHLFPQADVPVLQVSLPRGTPPDQCFALGKALGPLADEGMLILASGVITHNLGRIDFSDSALPPDWAAEFDGWCAQSLVNRDVAALLNFMKAAPFASMAHPTIEHFAPLLVAVGAADRGHWTATFPVDGFEYGSISRRCVEFNQV